MANPLPLHGRDPQFESEIAHFNEDWSEKLKELWFKKPKGRPRKEEKRYCLECSKEFIITTSRDKKKRKYCSSMCSYIKSRKVNRPSKDQLKKDINSMYWLEIGRKYQVSDNAVRKWARNYDLI